MFVNTCELKASSPNKKNTIYVGVKKFYTIKLIIIVLLLKMFHFNYNYFKKIIHKWL